MSANGVMFLGHLGLGDHIICHSIVLKLAKENEAVEVFAKYHNVKSVEHMCEGLDNVSVIGVKDDKEAIEKVMFTNKRLISVGMFGDNWRYDQDGFDKCFYDQVAHLELSLKDSFSWKARDGKNSQEIINALYKNKDFCFVHDDASRGYNITVNTDLSIVRNSIRTETIFDYLPLIRLAKEVHCMDSSFALMIDRADVRCDKFIHRKIRKDDGWPTYQKKWNII